MRKRTILHQAAQVVTPIGPSARCGKEMNELLIIENGSVILDHNKIVFVGQDKDVHPEWLLHDEVVDCRGKVILPGFVDSHTHLVFAGTREDEFAKRMSGESYLSIMQQGGGIQRTINATRMSNKEDLLRDGLKRLLAMAAMGITTVEAKSGYGGTTESELLLCEIAHQLNKKGPIHVVPTLMAAHTIPKEYVNNPDDFVRLIIEEIIPKVAYQQWAEFCDVFLEKSAFSYSQSEKILIAAKASGLIAKIHADELSNQKGAQLAAKMQAISAEHLLCADQEGLLAMKKANTIATILPLTAFNLKEPFANVRWMIDQGMAVALATDFNPGSSYSYSIPMLMALAVVSMEMTVAEVITACTLNGAAALNRSSTTGSLEVGKNADVLVVDCPHYSFLMYHSGINLVEKVYCKGRQIV